MSFDDTSGDLPLVLPVRIRLRFRGPEVTLEVAVRESSGGALQAGDHANGSTSPTSGFALAFDIYSCTNHTSTSVARTYLVSSWKT